MKDIELIEAYLLHTLPDTEMSVVEMRIQSDPPFADLVTAYRNTFEVLEKKWLRNNVARAAGQYYKMRVLKIALVSLAVAAAIGIAGLSYFKNRSQVNLPEARQDHKVFVQSSLDSNYNASIRSVIDSVVISKGYAPVVMNGQRGQDTGIASGPVIVPEVFRDSFLNHDFQLEYKNDFQKFTINPAIANTLKCKGGTIIYLPAHCMAFGNGKEPQQAVVVSVQEYADYFEMWKHKVSTVSDGRLLQTGGSCYIVAESEGKKLGIKPGSDFTIAFSTVKDEQMKTFIGERDTAGELNWREVVQPEIHREVNENRALSNDAFFGQTKIDTQYCLKTVVSDEGFFDSKSDQYSFNQLSAMQDLNKVFDTFQSVRSEHLRNLFLNKRKLRMRFGVDSLGRLSSFDYNFKYDRNSDFTFNINKKLEKQLKSIAEYISENRQVAIPDKGGVNMIINVDLVPSIASMKDLKIQEVDSAASKEEQFRTEQSNRNILVSAGFGYINCDYFIKIKDVSDILIGIPSDKTDVRVFFKNFDAAAKCKNTLKVAKFSNAPVHEPILIVATLEKNGELLMCLIEAKVGEEIKLENFEPFATSKLQNFLKKVK